MRVERRTGLGLRIVAPGVIGGRDFVEVGVGQLAVDAVDEGAEFAGVDEEGLFAAVAEAAFDVGVFVLREKPASDEDLHAVEEMAGECDQAVGLDEGAAD